MLHTFLTPNTARFRSVTSSTVASASEQGKMRRGALLLNESPIDERQFATKAQEAVFRQKLFSYSHFLNHVPMKSKKIVNM